MDLRLPYYMAYPTPWLYDDDKIEQRDFEYVKSMYPADVKKLLPYVEEECERMSYGGSMIYDEYPDRLQIYLMCDRVYRRATEEEELGENARELIQILMLQEVLRRRGIHRRERKIFI